VSDDSGERNLDPTDERREKFRKDGRFAKARDAGGVAATFAVALVLAGSSERLLHLVRELFARTFGDLGALERAGAREVLRLGVTSTIDLAGAVVLAAMGASVIVGLAQSGFRPYIEMLEIKPERLDPRQAIGKLFSPKRAGQETAVAILRLGAVGYVAWRAFAIELPQMAALSRVPISAALPLMGAALGRVMVTSTVALFLVALVDYGQSWFTLSRELKMTRKERTDDARQQDGDPKAKARMKARSRAISRKRALSSVKNADVVVTNPTHVAVALRYGPKDPAPVVLAKGHDEVAMLIRAQARKHGIPIFENRRLARALDAEVKVGRPVPPAHFAAVARVLAFVYRLGKRRGGPRGTGRAQP
jgi:flagellar biosynthesis protein FlhB